MSPGCKLINMAQHEGLLKQWFDHKLGELKILWRASEHSFSKASFEDICVNKGPTLSVIQSDNNRVFGGYTSQNWIRYEPDNGGYSYTKDEKAWLFSFDHQTKLKVRSGGAKAIAHGKTKYRILPTFGYGFDLSTYENGHQTTESYSNLGYSYKLPPGIKYISE